MGRGARWIASIGVLGLLSWTACKPTSSPTARYREQGPPSYEISCAAGEPCSESVALLVGLSGPTEPTRCTAALIGPRTAVTAGHCVNAELAAASSCDRLWLGFAGSPNRPSEWIGCDRIRRIATSAGSLLAPDFAVLELERNAQRPSLALGSGSVARGEVVRVLSVTADRFYDHRPLVRSRRCVVDDGARISDWNPLPDPSVRVLSSCPIRQGSSGAPVLDRDGRLKGLVHAGGPPYFALGVMTLLPQPVDRHGG